MPRNKELRTVYLERKQDERLHALTKRTGLSMAGFIRDGVDLVLEREEAKLRALDAVEASKGAAANDLDQVLVAAAVGSR
jgi:predicted DNA-binding protein